MDAVFEDFISEEIALDEDCTEQSLVDTLLQNNGLECLIPSVHEQELDDVDLFVRLTEREMEILTAGYTLGVKVRLRLCIEAEQASRGIAQLATKEERGKRNSSKRSIDTVLIPDASKLVTKIIT
ncbi:uncharacterized protein LOC131682520 [Topomyia yanbarensis]|uniref:uncharacterized protein LOC131682519 n=1 Tax=Topomyia yanbarensis TaxID=2498891 RepID=UPI00273B6C3A|nr:uncharacterized protein LOC131682519 [Topomyia yanbarensis]XP_058820035.1 uncharacterized protein LOC131682520 [Topomyia yanbarensis]